MLNIKKQDEGTVNKNWNNLIRWYLRHFYDFHFRDKKVIFFGRVLFSGKKYTQILKPYYNWIKVRHMQIDILYKL